MLIIHGDNIVQSRLKLTEVVDQKKANNFHVVRIDGSGLNRAILESQVWSNSLFGDQKIIVLESLFSLPKSKKKDELIDLLKIINQDDELSSSIITWDNKTLPITTLKKIGSAQILEFKTSPVVFKWLDALNGKRQNLETQLKLSHQAVQSDGVELCMALLARQIRLLINAQEKQPISAPPFVINKLTAQAHTFTLDQLVKIHAQLVQIDRETKTSQLPLSLEKKLDLLIMKL
jgi:DNA polymerase III delta subunit